MNAFELRGVCKSYGDFTLHDVTLSLPTGSILGLVGENGAGKTTLIKLLLGAVSADSGDVRVLGQPKGGKAFRALKEDVGVVPDEAYFPEVLTAAQVGVILKSTYVHWDGAAFANYLKEFALPADRCFKDYSRGMKMKLAIAAALSHHPRLLVMDEATSGLDPMVRDEILDIFNDFTREEDHSILLSSHIVSDLEKICDYIAVMHCGRLLLCAEKDRLLDEYAVVRVTEAELAALPAQAVLGKKVNPYGVEALVKRASLPSGMTAELGTLEETLLLLMKGDAKQ